MWIFSKYGNKFYNFVKLCHCILLLLGCCEAIVFSVSQDSAKGNNSGDAMPAEENKTTENGRTSSPQITKSHVVEADQPTEVSTSKEENNSKDDKAKKLAGLEADISEKSPEDRLSLTELLAQLDMFGEDSKSLDSLQIQSGTRTSDIFSPHQQEKKSKPARSEFHLLPVTVKASLNTYSSKLACPAHLHLYKLVLDYVFQQLSKKLS